MEPLPDSQAASRRRLACAVLVVALVVSPVVARAGADVHHIHGLAFDPRVSDAILVATHTGLVRVRPGATPEWIGDHRWDLMGFTAHPGQPGMFFASGHPDLPTYQRERAGNLGLLVTEDGGRTWRSMTLKGRADFHALAYSPRGGGELYGWNVAGEPGLYRIGARSGTAERLQAGGLSDVLALTASPDGAPRLLAGTMRGLQVSVDAGQTWRPAGGLPAGLPVTAVAHHARDPRVVYAYVHGPEGGLMRSLDAGATWQAAGFAAGAGTPVIALAVGPGERISLATTAADLHVSSDAGRTWRPVLQRGRPVTDRR